MPTTTCARLCHREAANVSRANEIKMLTTLVGRGAFHWNVQCHQGTSGVFRKPSQWRWAVDSRINKLECQFTFRFVLLLLFLGGGNKNGGQMIPVPDYFNEDDRPNNRRSNFSYVNQNNNNSISDRLGGGGGGSVLLDKDGLVVPRKPGNPCLDSMERKDLHRELLFHQKS